MTSALLVALLAIPAETAAARGCGRISGTRFSGGDEYFQGVATLHRPSCVRQRGSDPRGSRPINYVGYPGCPVTMTVIGQDGRRHKVCVNTSGTPARPVIKPVVSGPLVAAAFQRIPVPHIRSVSQPRAKTLVNFDTIFYCDATPFTTGVTLLGQRVQLRIRPVAFRWEFGDGSTLSTASAGAAYPAKVITHRYPKAHVSVRHHVVVTWGATWRIGNGAWRPVQGTVTTTGPVTDLRIAEATPVLAGSS